jgi:hypothetical protein
MIIGKVDLDALNRTIDHIEEEIGRTVNYTIFSQDEWHERVTQEHSFVMDVLNRDKVFLIGDEGTLSERETVRTN